MNFSDKYKSATGLIARFGIVGTTALVVYFGVLLGMVEWLQIPVMVATAIAYIFVTIENYVLHHLWTFKSTQRHTIAFPRFIASNVAGFMINWAIMYTGVQALEINYLLVQVAAVGAVIAWNLILGSSWIFTRRANIGSDA